MPWPSKYGTAASQQVTPPEPPPERDINSAQYYAPWKSNHFGVNSEFAPTWKSGYDPEDSPAFSVPVRPGGPFSSGVFYPADSGGVNSTQLGLAVNWPSAALLAGRSKFNGVNRTLNLITIESRPAGSASWRASTTTILFDADEIQDPFASDQAYFFSASPSDEYRAFATYFGNTQKYYSVIRAGSELSPQSRLKPYCSGYFSRDAGFGSVRQVNEYKTGVVVLFQNVETRGGSVGGLGPGNGRAKQFEFYSGYANRLTSDIAIRTGFAQIFANGHTRSVLQYGQHT